MLARRAEASLRREHRPRADHAAHSRTHETSHANAHTRAHRRSNKAHTCAHPFTQQKAIGRTNAPAIGVTNQFADDGSYARADGEPL